MSRRFWEVVPRRLVLRGGGGGRWIDRNDCKRDIGPWFKSTKPGYNFFLANLANFANFHVAAILAIYTYNMYDFKRVTYNLPQKYKTI